MLEKELKKLVKEIMAEAKKDGEPITEEEALEMAQMEIKAKGAQSDLAQPSKRKPRKPSEPDKEKVEIIEKLCNFLLTNGEPDATIVNVQREITYRDYSIQLIKHRPPKGDK